VCEQDGACPPHERQLERESGRAGLGLADAARELSCIKSCSDRTTRAIATFATNEPQYATRSLLSRSRVDWAIVHVFIDRGFNSADSVIYGHTHFVS
jgi:hypothetical protein